MEQEIYQVDAFTSEAFSGNPAGVCILKKPLPDPLLLKIAAEMNLAETAFLLRGKENTLRWFSPTMEVQLCGHATLAMVWILFSTGMLQENEPIHFSTRSGILKCKVNNKLIEMDFPVIRTSIPEKSSIPNNTLFNALTMETSKEGYLIAELQNEEKIRSFIPDFTTLKALGAYVIILTAPGSNDYDFISRVFAPAFGINEDSVTGSAHCALTPFWNKKTGKTTFKAFQASPRGGEICTELKGNRILLKGKAITVLKGTLYV